MAERSKFAFADFSFAAFKVAIALSASAVAVAFLVMPSLAATHEQILAKCKEAARPQIRACRHGKHSGDRESNREACRETIGASLVHACVAREQQKKQPAKRRRRRLRTKQR